MHSFLHFMYKIFISTIITAMAAVVKRRVFQHVGVSH